MKAIVLAGGKGTRLFPATKVVSKQLLPIYDKPMIFYPLSVVMLAGITNILIITTKADVDLFKNLLGNGSELGLKISYEIQNEPRGIAHAIQVAESFIDNDSFCLVLGDNIFYGQGLQTILIDAIDKNVGATIFGYYVKDPERYGVVKFDHQDEPVEIVEKPNSFISNYAIPGLYIYDENAIAYSKELSPSKRGELEITDLNKIYLEKNKLKVVKLGRGLAWLDTGTHESILEASSFVQSIQKRQGLYIASLEEIAYRKGFIDKSQLLTITQQLYDKDYKDYLIKICEE